MLEPQQGKIIETQPKIKVEDHAWQLAIQTGQVATVDFAHLAKLETALQDVYLRGRAMLSFVEERAMLTRAIFAGEAPDYWLLFNSPDEVDPSSYYYLQLGRNVQGTKCGPFEYNEVRLGAIKLAQARKPTGLEKRLGLVKPQTSASTGLSAKQPVVGELVFLREARAIKTSFAPDIKTSLIIREILDQLKAAENSPRQHLQLGLILPKGGERWASFPALTPVTKFGSRIETN